MRQEIRLLQFLVCEKFQQKKQDGYSAELIRSNLHVSHFPFFFKDLLVVTCWRKDNRFHKEVIEYVTGYGTSCRSPHMDIEPVKDSIIFRWHTHLFPADFAIEEPTTVQIRVFLDSKIQWESYLLIEKNPVA